MPPVIEGPFRFIVGLAKDTGRGVPFVCPRMHPGGGLSMGHNSIPGGYRGSVQHLGDLSRCHDVKGPAVSRTSVLSENYLYVSGGQAYFTIYFSEVTLADAANLLEYSLTIAGRPTKALVLQHSSTSLAVTVALGENRPGDSAQITFYPNTAELLTHLPVTDEYREFYNTPPNYDPWGDMLAYQNAAIESAPASIALPYRGQSISLTKAVQQIAAGTVQVLYRLRPSSRHTVNGILWVVSAWHVTPSGANWNLSGSLCVRHDVCSAKPGALPREVPGHWPSSLSTSPLSPASTPSGTINRTFSSQPVQTRSEIIAGFEIVTVYLADGSSSELARINVGDLASVSDVTSQMFQWHRLDALVVTPGAKSVSLLTPPFPGNNPTRYYLGTERPIAVEGAYVPR